MLTLLNINAVNITEIAPPIRYHKQFAPDGTNVNFVQIINQNSIYVRTYEKGVEGETLSCGTGVVASAIAAFNKFNLHIKKHENI